MTMCAQHNKKYERPIEILLVEDNEGDVFLTKRAFGKSGLPSNIRVVGDGEAAIEALHASVRGVKDTSSDIDMILLDINLPKKDGRQVLAEMKADENFKHIPVIMLTSSDAEEDIVQTYGMHANSYIVKPRSPAHFKKVVEAVEDFWFKTATLPSEVQKNG